MRALEKRNFQRASKLTQALAMLLNFCANLLSYHVVSFDSFQVTIGKQQVYPHILTASCHAYDIGPSRLLKLLQSHSILFLIPVFLVCLFLSGA